MLTSHILEKVERLCTDVGIIDQGKIVLSGPMADIRSVVTRNLDGADDVGLEALFLKVTSSDTSSRKLSWL